jgi:hypothetical protein
MDGVTLLMGNPLGASCCVRGRSLVRTRPPQSACGCGRMQAPLTKGVARSPASLSPDFANPAIFIARQEIDRGQGRCLEGSQDGRPRASKFIPPGRWRCSRSACRRKVSRLPLLTEWRSAFRSERLGAPIMTLAGFKSRWTPIRVSRSRCLSWSFGSTSAPRRQASLATS